MPVEQLHTIKAGTTRQLVFLYATDASSSALPSKGLASSIPNATAAYAREGEPGVHRVQLTQGRLGVWAPGSLAEVDADLMPGVYQVGLPDEMIAEGSTRAILSIQIDGASIRPIEVNLVAFDPQDAERIGVWGLANHKRHEFLRTALPRLTEMEYELGQQAERALRDQLSGTQRD